MESGFTLLDFIRIFKRRKYLILLIGVTISVVSYFAFLRSKAVYRATAFVEISQGSAFSESIVSEMQFFGSSDNIATQSKIITSQRIVFLALQRIDMIDTLINYSDFNSHPDYFSLVNQFQGRLNASPVELRRSNMMTDIIEVSTEADNPSLAITFINTLVDVYREESKKDQNQEANETEAFIQKQLTNYTLKLAESESKLLKFIKNTLPGVELEHGDVIELQVGYGQIREKISNGSNLIAKLKQRKRDPNKYDDWTAIATKSGENDLNLFSSLIKYQAEKARLLEFHHESSQKVQSVETRIQTAIDAVLANMYGKLSKLKDQEKATLNLLESNIEYDQLKRDVAMNVRLVEHLSTSYQDALIQTSKDIEPVKILEFATSAQMIVGLTGMRGIMVVILVGFSIGFMVAMYLEMYNTSILAIEDVEKYVNLPVLGVIPHINSPNGDSIFGSAKNSNGNGAIQKPHGLTVHFSPKSTISESYRALRTTLEFALASSSGKVILFTSSVLGEGKSTSITNVAIALSQIGNRVLLIDSNLRRPSIYRAFGLHRSPGLTDIIYGTVQWQDAISGITDFLLGETLEISEALLSPGLDNLDIITSGKIPSNPSELLSQSKYQQFISEVKEHYDVVLIDSPPLLSVTDSAIIAPNCDHVVLVYQIGKAARSSLSRTKATLENVDANVLGVILNDAKSELSKTTHPSEYKRSYYGEEVKS